MERTRSTWGTGVCMQGFPTDEQQIKMRDRIKVQQVGPRPL
jgi:hypothetical protein